MMAYLDFYNSENFSKDQLNDIHKLIPHPVQDKSEIFAALQRWAFLQIKQINPLKYNAEIRDEISAVGQSAEKLWHKIINLSEDASIRLETYLDAPASFHAAEVLSKLNKAAELATDSKVKKGRPATSDFRNALLQLMLIWRWANKGNSFGNKFLDFAEVPMSVAFGDNEQGQPIEELMREIRPELNKHPQGYTFHQLPNKSGQKDK